MASARNRVLAMEHLELRTLLAGDVALLRTTSPPQETVLLPTTLSAPPSETPLRAPISTAAALSAESVDAIYAELIPISDSNTGESEGGLRSCEIPLRGSLPRAVTIEEAYSGNTVYEGVATTSVVDACFLPNGSYVLRHKNDSDEGRSVAFELTQSGVQLVDTTLTFDGTVPRRVQITSPTDSAIRSDYWIYSPTIDPVGFLADGEYSIQSAASGERWRQGKLFIGEGLPSYRLFLERIERGTAWKLDWGSIGTSSGIGSSPTIHVTVDDGLSTLLDDSLSTGYATIRSASSYLRVELTLPGRVTQTFEVGERPLLPFEVRLDGDLPKHVTIQDILGSVVAERDVNENRINLQEFSAGRYLLTHVTSGDANRTMTVVIDALGVQSFDTRLTFEGQLPRRVRIRQSDTSSVIWDNWIYSAQLDVVGLLPAGSYSVRNAASGQHWLDGKLVIDPLVPSNRIFVEPRADGLGWRVDWGTLAGISSVHIKVSDGRSLLADQETTSTSAYFTTASDYLRFELTIPGQSPRVLEVGNRPAAASTVTVSGSLPRRLQIIDARDGGVVRDELIQQSEVSIQDLPTGHYVLRHAGTNESYRSIALAIDRDLDASLSFGTHLTLDGSLPQRVRINTLDGTTVWDNWVYGAELDVVGILPEGEYWVQRAAPSQSWREGRLTVGAALPSYRFYTEQITEPSGWRIDWGSFEDFHSMNVRVTDGIDLVLEGDPSTKCWNIETSSTYLKSQLTIVPGIAATLESGERPASPFDVTIDGTFPQHVTVLDSLTGQIVFERNVTSQRLEFSDLPAGNYVLKHGILDQTPASMLLAIDAQRAESFTTQLDLPGNIPQRVRISDATSGATLWDNWLYGNSLDVVGLLPEGAYQIARAASGENWKIGALTIGPRVPAYRVYEEYVSDQTSFLDTGLPGGNEGNRATVRVGGEVVSQYDLYDAGIEINVPTGPHQIVVEPVPKFHYVHLDGELPQHVVLTDTSNGALVRQFDTSNSDVDFTETAIGNYLLQYSPVTSSDLPSALQLTIAEHETIVTSPTVTLEGALPRFVRITNRDTNEVVWNYWNYANAFDVVKLLPAGDYLVEHAAPQEHFVHGILRIAANLPSYRLYIETRDDGVLHVDSGSLGTFDSLDIRVSIDGEPVVESTLTTPTSTLTVPHGIVQVEVETPNGEVESFDTCALAAMAADGLCREYDYTLEATLTTSTQYGFALPSNLTNDLTSVTITTLPSHGTLKQGESSRYVTYSPVADFVGTDLFRFETTLPGGETETGLVLINVVPAANPNRGYFVPGVGTVGAEYETPAAPYLASGASLPESMVVSSVFSQVVERIDVDGTVRWRHTTPHPGSSIAVIGSFAIWADYDAVRFLDLDDGTLMKTVQPNLGTAGTLQFVNPLDPQRLLIGWYDTSDISHIGVYDMQGNELWLSPHSYAFPRWAEVSDGMLIVADTYAHRVVAHNMLNGNTVFEIPAYFPNDVRSVGPYSILITEEHSDRIWTYDWLRGDRRLLLAAPGDRSNLFLPLLDVINLSESPNQRIDPGSTTSKSKASVEYAGSRTVYAPNSAIQLPDGSYYVVDSDNHRVLHVGASGEILAELLGFNGPTKVAYIPAN